MRRLLTALALMLAYSADSVAAVKVVYGINEHNVDSNYKLSESVTSQVIHHQGKVPDALPPLWSEGKDAPLSAAFGAAIPAGWKVYIHNDIDESVPVSWDSQGENWVSTLFHVGINHGYSFDIHWDQRWVLVNARDIRKGLTDEDKPNIEIVGASIPPGTEGHLVIDGKVIKIRSR